MSLLKDFSKDFVLMERTRVSDGAGGFTTTWNEGVVFTMPQAHDTTVEAQTAELNGTASTYKFYPAKNIKLNQGDVFKRVEDGQVFIVTIPSGEDVTPDMSNLNLTVVYARKWVLADD